MARWRPVAAHLDTACWALTALWLVATLGITAWDWQGRWYTAGHSEHYQLKLWVFWASVAAPVVLVALLLRFALSVSWLARWVYGMAVLVVGVATWSRLIEPEMLRVRETVIQGLPAGAQPVRLALVSDIHWGLFGRDYQLRRLVQRLNTLHVDAVLVAGDWTYEPSLDLRAGLAPLAQLQAPVFAVLGNHDLQAPGPRIADELRSALQQQKVQVIEGQSIRWRGWELVGIDDAWGGKPHAQIRTLLTPTGGARLVLTHQPDTVDLFPPDSAFLTLAGHSHGGQIQLPWLTPLVLRATMRNDWWDGLYATRAGRLFVTTGIGMIGLPARLGVPPTIDLIDLRR